MYQTKPGETAYEPDTESATFDEALAEIRRLRDGICTLVGYYENDGSILRWCFHGEELDLR